MTREEIEGYVAEGRAAKDKWVAEHGAQALQWAEYRRSKHAYGTKMRWYWQGLCEALLEEG